MSVFATMDDADLVELWEERSAVIEFEAGRPRWNADRLAAKWIKQTFGRLPAAIEEQLEEGKGNAAD